MVVRDIPGSGLAECGVPPEQLARVLAAMDAIAGAALDADALSAVGAERAMQVTGAQGAVVELVDGEELVYAAGAGTAFAHRGLRLPAGASLSGACVGSGEVLVCDDTDLDARVDREACRRIGARSMVLVPLQHSGRTSGALKVVSGVPGAFDQGDVDALRLMAGLLGAGLGQALESSAHRELLRQHAATNQRLREEIGERVRAERAAAAVEERLSLAIAIVDMGTWDWDVRADTIVWSDNVEALHGLAPGSFDRTFASWLALVHPDDRVAVTEAVQRALADGVGRYDAEFRIVWPCGEVRWLRGRAQAYYDPSGAPARMVGTVVDVTERHRAEAELRTAWAEAEQARRGAEAANSAKNDFLSRMSHELRTPLNAVLGFAQLLEMDATDEQKASVVHIRRAGAHLLGLIDEVLDIARIESGHLHLSPEPVLVAEVVGEVLDLIRPLADSRGLQLSVADGTAIDRHMVADRQRIKQVLLNLLSNAVKYNRPGGSIQIACDEAVDAAGAHLRLTVRDTGLGIAAENLDRLFLPFERLGAEHTDVEGSGVGLALTQRLVQAMGGEIEVSSQVGEGSAFTVTMARAEAPGGLGLQPGRTGRAHPATGSAETDGHVPEAHATPLNLLYVEDNASNARLLEQLVARRPGWRLTIAAQGGIGLELARSLASGPGVHLVLLDLHLPDMHGVEVLRHLRADPTTADVPVVVLSADATPGQLRRVLASGADRYLTKPLDVAQVFEILDTIAADHVAAAAVRTC